MGFLAKIPRVVGGAIIGAAGELGGAALQARGAGKATEAQERATAEALAFQREQAAKEAEWNRMAWEDYVARRQSLLSRYGIDIPGLGAGLGPAPGAVPRGAPPPAGGPPPGVPPGGGAPGLTLADLASARSPYAGPDLGRWNEWESYGLRR